MTAVGKDELMRFPFHRRNLRSASHAPERPDSRRIDVRGIELFVTTAERDDSSFWNRFESGVWEPETLDLMDLLLGPGAHFVDVGAWIGPTALYAAARGAAVTAYECDPVALRLLRRNLELNERLARRIGVRDFALGTADGEITLWSQALGNSESSVFAEHEREGALVPTPDTAVVEMRDARAVLEAEGDLFRPSTLVKIDVEGSEFHLLPHLTDLLRSSAAVWYVSFHEFNVNANGVVRADLMSASLDAVAELHWYDVRLAPLDKAATMQAVADGSWPTGASLVFCRRPLVP
jgi:FkbM family methyltransferase